MITSEEQAEIEAALLKAEEEAPAATAGGGGDGAGTSADHFAAVAMEEAAAVDDVELALSQLTSPSNPAPKKHKGGDGATSSQPIEFSLGKHMGGMKPGPRFRFHFSARLSLLL